MRRLRIHTEGQQLVLSRRRAAYLPPLAGMAAVTALALRLCLLHTPVAGFRPAQTLEEVHVLAVVLLALCVPFLVIGLSRLRAQAWVFNWGLGLVLFNGQFVCRFEDLCSVHLDRDYYAVTSPSVVWVLYLRTWAGSNIELAREGVFGVGRREIQEKAETICGSLGVALVMPDRYQPKLWEPGRDAPAPSPAVPRPWGGARPPRAREADPAGTAGEEASQLTDVAFAEELRRFHFQDWRFEPLFVYAGRAGAPARGIADAGASERPDCRSLGIRVRYTVVDDGDPGRGRHPRQVVHFFDVSSASGRREGWRVWVRDFLWQQVQSILEHEARERSFCGEGLAPDLHTAAGGTLRPRRG